MAGKNTRKRSFYTKLFVAIAFLSILVWVTITVEDLLEPPPKTTVAEQYQGTVPLVYSPRYNFDAFGLENLHPFDTRKYKKIHDYLVQSKTRQNENFLCPKAITDKQLKLVHSDDYLNGSLKK